MKTQIFVLLFSSCLLFSCEKDDDANPNNGSNILFNSDLTYGAATDQDGNSYKTIQIGTQTWMAENLRATVYNDGSSIPNVTDKNEWTYLTTGAYCNVNHTTNSDSISTYGRLYNWNAVNSGKLAPTGWHIPTYAELTTLITYLGGEAVAGGKMKETGTTHWKADNILATNESGFTAIPSGYINSIGEFQSSGMGGYFWCSDHYGSQTSWDIYLFYNTGELNRNYNPMNNGFSIRCIKD